MKRKFLAVLIGLAFAGSAIGNGIGNDNPPSDGGTGAVQTNTQTNSPKIVNKPVNIADAFAIGQGGNATSYGGNTSLWASLGVQGGDQFTSTYTPITNAPVTTNTVTNTNTTTSSVANSGNSSVRNSNDISNAGNNVGTANVVVQGDQAQARNPVSSAVAPIVYTGSDQCLVAAAVGAQGVGFGISFGTATRDEICEALKLVRQLVSMGFPEQALKLLKAADPRVAAAFQ